MESLKNFSFQQKKLEFKEKIEDFDFGLEQKKQKIKDRVEHFDIKQEIRNQSSSLREYLSDEINRIFIIIIFLPIFGAFICILSGATCLQISNVHFQSSISPLCKYSFKINFCSNSKV